MKYFTKEWYNAVQRSMILDYTPIPDKDCYDEDIERLYRNELDENLHLERRLAEMSNKEFNERSARATHRRIFEKRRVPHAKEFFPNRVVDAVDARLLALGYIPQSIFANLKKEIEAETETFERRIKEGRKILENQNVPEEVAEQFYFHDAFVLAARRSDKDYHIFVENVFDETLPPYVKIIFKNAYFVDREKGLRIIAKEDSKDRFIFSNCRYMYDEIYRNDKGYEFHFMLWTPNALRYLTVACEDVKFDGKFDIQEIWNKK